MDQEQHEQLAKLASAVAAEVEELLEAHDENKLEAGAKELEVQSEETLDLPEIPNTEELELEVEFADPKEQEDKEWKERTNLDEESLCGAVETVIFMHERPVSLQKIKNMIDPEMPLRVLHEAISKLQEEYEKKHHGIRLQEVADGYQFRTKAIFSKYVQGIFKVQSLVLSPTALEVLAIIAYKQPVSRSEVDRIRGVDSSHIVRALMDRRLVKVTGRSEDAGRPTVYGTTDEFLEVFNLKTIDELPPEHELEELLDKNKIGEISDIKTVVSVSDDEFSFDDIDELDQLQSTIKEISADTFFTKELKVNNKDKEVKKSAFDVLEAYLAKDDIVKVNQSSIDSEPLSMALDPKVIGDLNAGPFNAPDPDDFVDMSVDEEEVEAQANEPEENFEELFEETKIDTEKVELEKALDDAFDKLMAGANVTIDEKSLGESEKKLDDIAQNIEHSAGEFDLDINLKYGDESEDDNKLD